MNGALNKGLNGQKGEGNMLFTMTMTALFNWRLQVIDNKLKLTKLRLFNIFCKYTFAHQEIRLSGKPVIYGSQNEMPLSQ